MKNTDYIELYQIFDRKYFYSIFNSLFDFFRGDLWVFSVTLTALFLIKKNNDTKRSSIVFIIMNFREPSEEDIDSFISTLPQTFFTHMDVMRCYSILLRNEYSQNKDLTQIHHTEPIIRQINDGKRVPMRWSTIEIDALRQGVEKYGKGNWSKILALFPSVFGPTGRTGRDLKKKWLGIENKGKNIQKPIENLIT